MLHENNKEKYEASIEADFINYLINMIANKQKGPDLNATMASFVASINKLRMKPFDITDSTAELMISSN